MMNADEMFGLAVRILGVVLLCYGVQDLVDSGLFKLDYFILMDSNPSYYFIRGLLSFVAGIYFLRGAPLLVGLAYPAEDEDEDEEETKISKSARDENQP
jgi:hypothetical protein